MATSDEKMIELLDKILRVEAIQVAAGKSVTEGVRLLKLADLDNQTIAEILNTTAATVRTLAAGKRAAAAGKKGKGKKNKGKGS